MKRPRDVLDLFGSLSRADMADIICARHYTRSVPAGKSHYFYHDEAIVIFSIPANPYISEFLTDEPCAVWELSRLWAPDGHRPNLLTEAISETTSELRRLEPDCLALVSYADPAAGHTGGVYRAASWVYLGQTEETRSYQSPDGRIIPRRKFHSGDSHINKAEIEARGFVELRREGKHRFARGLTKRIRKRIESLNHAE